MGDSPEPPDVTLLDACAVISLYATRRMDAILAAVPTDVGVVDLVRTEAHYVLRGGPGEDAREREPVDLEPLIVSGDLRVVAPTESEIAAFVDLTLVLDDGEAMTAAVAIERGWVVVTDDRKAERILSGRVQTRSTLDLVKAWADQTTVDAGTLHATLSDLRERGSYLPRRAHPLRGWWDAVTGSA
jgi:predicted nucleic acid-binding protein